MFLTLGACSSEFGCSKKSDDNEKKSKERNKSSAGHTPVRKPTTKEKKKEEDKESPADGEVPGAKKRSDECTNSKDKEAEKDKKDILVEPDLEKYPPIHVRPTQKKGKNKNVPLPKQPDSKESEQTTGADKPSPLSAKIRPKLIPLDKKRMKIAQGALVGKTDYPTMDDVKSDWKTLVEEEQKKQMDTKQAVAKTKAKKDKSSSEESSKKHRKKTDKKSAESTDEE